MISSSPRPQLTSLTMPSCKSKTKFLPATFAWLLLLGTTTLFFYFPCYQWYIEHQQWYAVPIFQGIITIFVLINFSMATFMDPGVIPRASPDEDRDDDFRAPLYRQASPLTPEVEVYSRGVATPARLCYKELSLGSPY